MIYEKYYKTFLNAVMEEFVRSYLAWFYHINKFKIIFPEDNTKIPKPSFDGEEGILEFMKSVPDTNFSLNDKMFKTQDIINLIKNISDVLWKEDNADSGIEENFKNYFEQSIKSLSFGDKYDDKGTEPIISYFIGIVSADSDEKKKIKEEIAAIEKIDDKYQKLVEQIFFGNDPKKNIRDHWKEDFNVYPIFQKRDFIPTQALARAGLLIDIILDGI